MKKKEILIILGLIFLMTTVFFYKLFLFRLVPFPGDLLVSNYKPWQAYSFLGFVPGTFPSKDQYFDVLRQLYPWKTLIIGLFKNGEIPLWNPYNFSGSPLLSNFQSAVLYPLNLFYLILPQIFVWSLGIFLQPFLTAFFTYLFARKVRISILGSLLAAFSFAFSLFLIVWLEYGTVGQVILWLPLSLLAVEFLLEKFQKKWFLVFVFSLTLSLFAGHPQVFVYLFAFVFAYVFFRLRALKKPRRIFLKFGFWFLLPWGLGAVQLLPGLELFLNAARTSYPYNFLIEKVLIQPWQLVMLVVPDFFGNPATRSYLIADTYVGKTISIGLVSLFFVLVTIVFRKNNFLKFFLGVSFFLLLFITSNPLTRFFYRLDIPFISGSSVTLSVFILNFCLSILAGFGLDLLRKAKFGKKTLFPVFVLSAIFFLLWFVVFFKPNLPVSSRNLIYSTIIFGLAVSLFILGIVKVRFRLIIFLLLFLLQLFDLFYFFHKFNPFVSAKLVYPKTSILEFLQKEAGIDRFWGYGTAAIEANFATQYSLFSPDGYDPLYPRRYGEFIQSSLEGKIKTEFSPQTRSDAIIAHGFGQEDFSANLSRLKVLDLLGTKYILDRVENGSTNKTFPLEQFEMIFNTDGWRVFKNLKALPRAFLVSDYQIFKTKEDFEKIFFSREFNPAKTVLLEQEPNYHLNDLNHLSKAEIISYRPNTVILATETNADQILFLSDVYYPGWKAFIDEAETKIYRADYAFRAVIVPAGKHQVVFTFAPFSFKMGLIISLLTGFLILVNLKYVKENK